MQQIHNNINNYTNNYNNHNYRKRKCTFDDVEKILKKRGYFENCAFNNCFNNCTFNVA